MALEHCNCIPHRGGIYGFGAWCKEHRRLFEDYEFQKAKADEMVRRYEERGEHVSALEGQINLLHAALSALHGRYNDRKGIPFSLDQQVRNALALGLAPDGEVKS